MNWFEKLKKVVTETTVELVLITVGSVTTILSIWYTTIYHIETGDSWIIAVSFSSSIVVFLIIIFEFATKILLDKKYVKAGLLYGAWALLVTYSMQSTVAGQYAGTMERRIENERVVLAATEADKRDRIDEQKERERQQALEEVQTEIKRLGEVLREGKGADGKPLSTWFVIQLQERLDAYQVKRDKLLVPDTETKIGRGEIEEDRGADPIIQSNVYRFYGEVLGIEAIRVEFALAVFKGIILDIMNVLCFMIVMMRERWKEDERKESEEREEQKRQDPTERRKRMTEAVARMAFGKGGAKNGMFPSWKTAHDRFGIMKGDYEWIVDTGVMNGVLSMRHGKVYRMKDLTAEEFLQEVEN